MDIIQLCEAGMLILFGCSWPFNIAKSWKSRTSKGKSVLFEVLVILGYTSGLAGKLIAWHSSGIWAYSIWFYIADIVMVGADICLYFRNAKLDKD